MFLRNQSGLYGAAGGGGGAALTGLTIQEVFSATDFSSSSTTDVVITGMSITPPAGTYAVDFWAETSIDSATGTNRVAVSIYVGGTQDTETGWEVSPPATLSGEFPVSVPALVSPNGAQAVDVRMKMVSSGTATFQNFRLRLIDLEDESWYEDAYDGTERTYTGADQAIVGTNITPAAGTYNVEFKAVASLSYATRFLLFTLKVDGVAVGEATDWRLDPKSGASYDRRVMVTMAATVTLNGAEEIQAFVRPSQASRIVKIYESQMKLYKEA